MDLWVQYLYVETISYKVVTYWVQYLYVEVFSYTVVTYWYCDS